MRHFRKLLTYRTECFSAALVLFALAFAVAIFLRAEQRWEREARWQVGETDWPDGREEAERDIAAGEMKWKTYGHMAGMSSRDREAKAVLRERFGVEFKVVAFCQVTRELMRHVEEYNKRIRQEVDRVHGAGAMGQFWEEFNRTHAR